MSSVFIHSPLHRIMIHGPSHHKRVGILLKTDDPAISNPVHMGKRRSHGFSGGFVDSTVLSKRDNRFAGIEPMRNDRLPRVPFNSKRFEHILQDFFCTNMGASPRESIVLDPKRR